MKMTRKLIPALAMLLVSAIMLSTASFAWFAMSTQVTAKNMQVNVKSDSLALVILAEGENLAATKNADDVRDGAGRQIQDDGVAFSDNTAIVEDFQVFPAAYESGTATVTAFNNLASWYTASSADTQTGAIDGDTKTNLNDEGIASFAGYVIRYKYYVTLSVGSNPITSLSVNNMEITTSNGKNVEAVKVVVACGSAAEEFNSAKTTGSVNLISDFTKDAANGLDSSEVAEIYVYVYYDGNHGNVTTEKFETLGAANIEFTMQGA